jgi:hypothetical protein
MLTLSPLLRTHKQQAPTYKIQTPGNTGATDLCNSGGKHISPVTFKTYLLWPQPNTVSIKVQKLNPIL